MTGIYWILSIRPTPLCILPAVATGSIPDFRHVRRCSMFLSRCKADQAPLVNDRRQSMTDFLLTRNAQMPSCLEYSMQALFARACSL